ncbi:GGDEF domain-containing protein [Alteromonas pelagimontana]|uniref:GGDEF domain-containing protein n=1 Tax=Alteromonas pelagimontana TaxID=1858656 RepID=A0A6M4MFT5_9ALTE|nr:bifunctional diguanylate cyclase/phosphodiesterase [Alteromonas pelagimontana]QJR82024.1 GGDEF domain-containing protein [Alteromonas pelagimontana]
MKSRFDFFTSLNALLPDITYRVAQVRAVLVVFIALFIILTVSALWRGEGEWLLEQTTIILFFLILLKYMSADTSNMVAGMSLWTVTIFASSIAFYYDGLFDTALFLYPGVLIFASFLGGKTIILPLAFYMLFSFYFFAYAISIDLIENAYDVPEAAWRKAADMSLMLLLYGLGIILITHYVKGLLQRLTDQKKRTELIRKDAESRLLFDEQTSLPNGEKCKRDFGSVVLSAHKKAQVVGFIILRMNNFDWINSTLGHKLGDAVLASLSERYIKLEDDSTRVYRTSGIEFTFIKQAPDFESLNDFCHQAIRSTIMPLAISDFDFEMSCALGIAAAPFDGTDFEELRRKASFAVYRAKKDEQNSYRFFENDMKDAIQRKLQLTHELKTAIELNQFELFYQPKVELATNQIVGAEALIRWKKDGNYLLPKEFIPVAEESGLIVEIGRWALEAACLECARWQQAGLHGMTVAVNLSPVQFKRGSLPTHVFRALQKSGLDPNLLELEITESLFIDDPDHVKQQVHAMVERGVNFAIDDFGTGYSNLNYLAKFNASTLKIDMSFVREMVQNPQQQHIVSAIIKMSQVMDLENIAEGVEDAQTAALLREQGCIYGQGFYWSPPLPAGEFFQFVRDQPQAA